MNVTFYDEHPLPIETISSVDNTTLIILRRNINEVVIENDSQWRCEEKRFYYPTIIFASDIENQFDEWWEFELSLADIKAAKISVLNNVCNSQIFAGFDATLSDGKIYHFDFDLEAQSNLTGLVIQIANGVTECDYYDCNGTCLTLSPEDVSILNRHALAYKSYHISYYHCLCNWINHLDSADDIWKIQYGDELPQEFCNAYLKKWASTIGIDVPTNDT